MVLIKRKWIGTTGTKNISTALIIQKTIEERLKEYSKYRRIEKFPFTDTEDKFLEKCSGKFFGQDNLHILKDNLNDSEKRVFMHFVIEQWCLSKQI